MAADPGGGPASGFRGGRPASHMLGLPPAPVDGPVVLDVLDDAPSEPVVLEPVALEPVVLDVLDVLPTIIMSHPPLVVGAMPPAPLGMTPPLPPLPAVPPASVVG